MSARGQVKVVDQLLRRNLLRPQETQDGHLDAEHGRTRETRRCSWLPVTALHGHRPDETTCAEVCTVDAHTHTHTQRDSDSEIICIIIKNYNNNLLLLINYSGHECWSKWKQLKFKNFYPFIHSKLNMARLISINNEFCSHQKHLISRGTHCYSYQHYLFFKAWWWQLHS